MTAPRRAWLSALDWIGIVIFAIIGRASHAESVDLIGVAGTALPFVAANVIGGVLLRSWRRPADLWPTGVALWLITVAVGMLIRLATGAAVVFPFVVVATISLGVLLLGWRTVLHLATRAQRG